MSESDATISKMIFQSEVDAGAKVDDTTLVIPDMPTAERDQALGMYMDIVSRLEGSIHMLFWGLLHTDLATSRILLTKLGFRQIIELLPALGRIALKKGDQKTLASLCKRLNKCVTKRNRIVHGSWQPYITVGGEDGRPVVKGATWQRQFTPTDPNVEAEIGKDQKVTANYQFSIATLHQAALDTNALALDITAFHKSLTYLPRPPHARASQAPPEAPPDTTR